MNPRSAMTREALVTELEIMFLFSKSSPSWKTREEEEHVSNMRNYGQY